MAFKTGKELEAVRAQIAAEDAAKAALKASHEAAVELCDARNTALNPRERHLVQSCRTRLLEGLPLSAGQAKWLLDIASRLGVANPA